MSSQETVDPVAEAMGMVMSGIAASLVIAFDDAGVERFRSAYGGFLDAAHADESQTDAVLEVAEVMTELLDFSLESFLDNPNIERLN